MIGTCGRGPASTASAPIEVVVFDAMMPHVGKRIKEEFGTRRDIGVSSGTRFATVRVSVVVGRSHDAARKCVEHSTAIAALLAPEKSGRRIVTTSPSARSMVGRNVTRRFEVSPATAGSKVNRGRFSPRLSPHRRPTALLVTTGVASVGPSAASDDMVRFVLFHFTPWIGRKMPAEDETTATTLVRLSMRVGPTCSTSRWSDAFHEKCAPLAERGDSLAGIAAWYMAEDEKAGRCHVMVSLGSRCICGWNDIEICVGSVAVNDRSGANGM